MKRRISDLLDHLRETEVELEYNAPLSPRRIEELTMSKITKKETKPGRMGFRLLVAAAIIGTLALSSVAAYHYGGWFQNFFAARNHDYLSDAQLAVLEESILELNQSVTDGGYTVTLESVVSDGANTYLKLSVEARDGSVLDGDYYYFAPFDINIPEAESDMIRCVSAGWEHVTDEDPKDNVAPLLMEINGSDFAGSEPGAVWTLKLPKLIESRGEGKATTDTVLAEGEWIFEFSLPAGSSALAELDMLAQPVTIQAQTYQESSSVPKETVEVTMTSFVLRSLSAVCTYEYDEGLKVEPVTVVLTDGTAITARFSTAGMNPDTATVRHTFRFETPVPLEEVDYVQFPGGVKIYAD